ncbi:ABC transporter, putative [Ixodes scapularis]|uniref:ABC transporter, putative n=1 Tax=Ixodes scapularis TaxID=6945 RepID=B7PIA3_IXOSC|nr:ABC transporter, putative [Ixodes scapularis]|eukprot:XP_002404739.1 ABC transporter, putative [Ixodes scapularis]
MDTGVVVCAAFDYKQDGLQDAGSSSGAVNALAVDSAKPQDGGQPVNGRHMTEQSGSRNYENIILEWRNLSFQVKCGKARNAIVTNLSGAARPGTLMAIMGPSGAGKTTLLNLLSGF